MDEEVERERLLDPEGIDEGGRRVGEQHHVRLVDRLEPTDGRAVEREAVAEDAFVERLGGHGEVLHDARQVAEADVDHADALVLDVSQQLVRIGEHSSSRSQADQSW